MVGREIAAQRGPSQKVTTLTTTSSGYPKKWLEETIWLPLHPDLQGCVHLVGGKQPGWNFHAILPRAARLGPLNGLDSLRAPFPLLLTTRLVNSRPCRWIDSLKSGQPGGRELSPPPGKEANCSCLVPLGLAGISQERSLSGAPRVFAVLRDKGCRFAALFVESYR